MADILQDKIAGRRFDVGRESKGDFYAAQKLPLLLRAREQSDAKNCRHSPRDQNVSAKSKVDVARKR